MPGVWNAIELSAQVLRPAALTAATEPLKITTATSERGRARIEIRAGYQGVAFFVDAEQLERAVRAVRICAEADDDKQQHLRRELEAGR